jgi:hypothetical protein
MSAISGNITGVQKVISLGKALPFITGMEHHVLQTGVAGASCRIVFFMNSFINTAITPRGIDEVTLNMNEGRAGSDPRITRR